MTSAEYNKLTPEQAEKGFRLCTTNAEVHLLAANALVEKGAIGIANSLCILAVEESIKAIFLYLKVAKNEMEIDVKKMFKRHSHKHEFGKEFFADFYKNAVRMLKQMLLGIQFNEDYFNELAKVDKPRWEKERKAYIDFQHRVKRLTKIKMEQELPAIQKWFNKADGQKSRGFYVDYQQNSWKTSDEITNEEYERSYFIADTLTTLAKLFLVMKDMKEGKFKG